MRNFVTFYSPASIIIMIKSKMGWAGHIGRMGDKRNTY
jgi:hypothetical protein